MPAPSAAPLDARQRQRRSTIGAFVGTAIEWYDFYIFGTAAALVFSQVFYPDVAPGAGLLASFATFWVGFLMRPVGGMVFGHFGDRFGRKNILVITLMMMGVATTLIGVLPGYAQVGVLAPVLLVVLRGLQGFAVGGEWGGAVLLSTENAQERKRGMAGAWVQQGSPAGSILATPVKIVADGSFIGRSAAMHACYHGEPDNTGVMLFEADRLTEFVVGAHKAGWTVATHAIGDRAISHVLDAVELAQRVAPPSRCSPSDRALRVRERRRRGPRGPPRRHPGAAGGVPIRLRRRHGRRGRPGAGR